MAYSDEVIAAARALYLKRYTPKEIQKKLGLNSPRIVYYWATKYEWYAQLSTEGVEEVIARRVMTLTEREHKSQEERDELDRLIGHHVKLMSARHRHTERMAEIEHMSVEMADSSPVSRGNSESGKKERRRKANDISGLTAESFEPFTKKLFAYQLHLRKNKIRRVRNLLKSRQIGATFYFAFEAFEDAVLTGDTQIFLSASKRQAEVFRTYIVKIAQQEFGIAIKGNPVRLSNMAELYFLATNSNTAQSNSGHVYIDEYLWIPGFERLNTVASGMATHSRWRLTYFSTPSGKTHQGYAFWSGDEWRRGDPKRKQVEFPSFDELRDGGRECPDGQWRYVVTLEDAIAGGFNLADINELRERYSETAFRMLFMCQFVDDKESIFRFEDLERCGVDPRIWEDFNPDEPAPFGNREVWGGFDPARGGDNATFVVVAPPLVEGERFRVLEKHHWRSMSFQYMAERIRAIKSRYNMTFIGIDVTGLGYGVYELVQGFARRETVAIHYSVESKNRLVMKMLDVVDARRIEWDEEAKDIPASFMAIRQETTGSGNKVTFTAERSEETGHADVFFAIAHALSNEPLNYKNKRKSTWVFADD
ncbi:terminase [Escherichia coli]|uniref:terminase large subunit domain-containing protein n=2 Tax=Escherichia coli TaxID=562 RepID=UPI000BDF5480|nr:terminase family protein [Escherichia coli]EFA6280568.1 terminase [Escherichia coli]EFC6773072.1 terminase [Escherichia coli]EFD5022658.1 terminase [Escherichia coli]EFD5036067.1 terminase [Escherichia coli]EFE6088912.1 terminase [Escherichia coli]